MVTTGYLYSRYHSRSRAVLCSVGHWVAVVRPTVTGWWWRRDCGWLRLYSVRCNTLERYCRCRKFGRLQVHLQWSATSITDGENSVNLQCSDSRPIHRFRSGTPPVEFERPSADATHRCARKMLRLVASTSCNRLKRELQHYTMSRISAPRLTR